MEVKFENGNFYRYTACISRGGNSTAKFNLIEWSVNGEIKSKELVQGSDTSREMAIEKLKAYNEASGEEHVLVDGAFVKKSVYNNSSNDKYHRTNRQKSNSSSFSR